MTATSQNGYNCEFLRSPGDPFSRYAHFVPGDSPIAKRNPVEMASVWPLWIGKTVNFTWCESPDCWDEVWIVDRRETLQVDGRTYAVYVIENDQTGRWPNWYHAKLTFWYSPEVGYFLKRSFQHISGKPEDLQNWTALSVSLR